MRTLSPLPTPTQASLQHSEQLRQLIVQTIDQANGSIPFREFMHMALYQPGFGYYVAGQEKFGAAGDFVTAPEISPLFSRCLANHCATVFSALPAKTKNTEVAHTILELGAGSGVMATDILQHLSSLNTLPQRYLILEPSPELRQRQQETLARSCPELLGRVEWLQALPEQSIRGIIIANEVADAMPVELFTIASNDNAQPNTPLLIDSVHVGHKQGELHFKPVETTAEQAEHIRETCIHCWDQGYNTFRPEQPYQSEYNPALAGWIRSLDNTLEQGEMLLIDYGYERSEYYRPERNQGTLLCHYRHHVHDQPLLWPSLQDITCSVDFTAVAEAADHTGLAVANYQTQADFLFSNGLEDLFNHQLKTHPEQQYQLAQQVRTLTLPAEMGERFKVMALTKGFTSANQTNTLSALGYNDRRHLL